MSDASSPKANFDINVRAVLWTGLALIVMILLAAGGAWLFWREWERIPGYRAPNTPFDITVAQPALESAPQADRAAYMKEKDALLHSWQLTDPQSGVARIPIDQAMQLMAERDAQRAQSNGAQR